MHEKLCDLLRIDILNTIWTPMRSLIFVDECRADPFVEIMPFQQFPGNSELHLQAALQATSGAFSQLALNQSERKRGRYSS